MSALGDTEKNKKTDISGPLRPVGLKNPWSALRNVSITIKLASIVVSLVAVSIGLLAVVIMTFDISTAVRAYVGGEGLYSKGQKDAAYYLTRYVHTHSTQDYQKYQQSISIPLGDHKARVELQKPHFNYDVAAQGFIEGGNVADDIPYMISMFRRFHSVSYLRDAIDLWTRADAVIAQLAQFGDELHGAVLANTLTKERETDYLKRIDQLNVAASPLERDFSLKLGEGARQIGRLLGIAIVIVAVILLGAGLWISWRISSELRIGILNLRKAAIKVTHGDLSHRVEVRSKDELGELAVVFNDMIKHRKGTEDALRGATEFREKIMQSVTNAIYVIDSSGRFVLVNRRTCIMTGYSEEELVGMSFDDLFPAERLEDIRRRFEGVIKTGVPIEHYETPLIRKDKEVIMISFSSAAFYKDDVTIGVVGAAEDITQRKIHDERLAHMANFDTLTNLPNRNLLIDRIAQALPRANRAGQIVALIFLDLDGFKFTNDTYGHTLGDDLIKLVAQKLARSLRVDDTVARIGGDEFVIMLCDVYTATDVEQITQQMLNAFSVPFNVDGRTLHITASAGVSLYPKDGQNYETLLKYADIAMYSAKEAGRNCLRFFTAEMASHTEQRVELEAAMHSALANDEFELQYQPQIDLKTGEICSAEALMRWQHVSLGVMSPVRFIPLAEATGLILPIGEWVLRTACRELKVWHQQGHQNLSIAVNISPRQFQQQDVVKLVREALQQTGIPPACLHLELTESVILQNSDVVIETLRELKALGVILAMDDFGTGYSGLGYLKRFPIDIIKIDQSFILDMIANPDAASIIRAILAMAQSLNLKTVAEGVETREQMDFLIANGCDVIQGFYLSSSLPAGEFRALLAEGRQLKWRSAHWPSLASRH